MAPEVAAEAMRAYAEETNRLNRERRSNGDSWKAELVKVEKQIRGIIEAIKEGMFHPSMKGEMDALEARKAELTEQLADIPEDTPDLLPSASAIYAKKVSALTAALAKPDERPQAAVALRMLIEKIVLTPGPERGEIFATLHGDLAKILEWTERQAIGKASKTTKPAVGAASLSVSMVAGQDLQTVSQYPKRSFRPAPRRQPKACPSAQPEAAQRRSHRRYSDGFDYARFFELADLRRYRSMRDERSGCPSLSAAQ